MADEVENTTQNQTFRVVFDDGHEVEVELKSRDIAKAERAGLDVETSPGMVGSYALVHVALLRMKRAGLIDFDLPDTAEGLEDIADLDVIEDGDDKGEGSGQVAATG